MFDKMRTDFNFSLETLSIKGLRKLLELGQQYQLPNAYICINQEGLTDILFSGWYWMLRHAVKIYTHCGNPNELRTLEKSWYKKKVMISQIYHEEPLFCASTMCFTIACLKGIFL